MAESELILNDEQIKAMKTYFASSIGSSGCDSIEAGLTALLNQFNIIRAKAIKDGKTADMLDVYIGYIQKLQGKAADICEDISSLIESFPDEVDNADNYQF